MRSVVVRHFAHAVVALGLVWSPRVVAETVQPSTVDATAPTTAAESGTLEQAIEEAFWTAEQLFQEERFAEAATWFTKALALSQRPEVTGVWREFSPQIAFNVAQSHRRAGNCNAAKMAYTHYTRGVASVPPEHQAWHEALEGECLAEKSSSVEDGPMQQPSRTEGEPAATGAWLLDVNSGAQRNHLADTASGETPNAWAWAAVGASAVSLGLAAGFWISGNSQDDLASNKRLYADAQPHVDAAVTRWTVAGVLAGAGAVFGGVSVYLFTRPGNQQSTNATVQFEGLRSGGTDLRIVGKF
jgi:hypothetical protein